MVADVAADAEKGSEGWMKDHTRPCTRCRSPIEKRGGCNHVTCWVCLKEFCWVCGKDWAEHNSATGGYYQCNLMMEAQQQQEGQQGVGVFQQQQRGQRQEVVREERRQRGGLGFLATAWRPAVVGGAGGGGDGGRGGGVGGGWLGEYRRQRRALLGLEEVAGMGVLPEPDDSVLRAMAADGAAAGRGAATVVSTAAAAAAGGGEALSDEEEEHYGYGGPQYMLEPLETTADAAGLAAASGPSLLTEVLQALCTCALQHKRRYFVMQHNTQELEEDQPRMLLEHMQLLLTALLQQPRLSGAPRSTLEVLSETEQSPEPLPRATGTAGGLGRRAFSPTWLDVALEEEWSIPCGFHGGVARGAFRRLSPGPAAAAYGSASVAAIPGGKRAGPDKKAVQRCLATSSMFRADPAGALSAPGGIVAAAAGGGGGGGVGSGAATAGAATIPWWCKDMSGMGRGAAASGAMPSLAGSLTATAAASGACAGLEAAPVTDAAENGTGARDQIMASSTASAGNASSVSAGSIGSSSGSSMVLQPAMKGRDQGAVAEQQLSQQEIAAVASTGVNAATASISSDAAAAEAAPAPAAAASGASLLSCELVQHWVQCLVRCRGALKWSAVLGYSLNSVGARRRLQVLQVSLSCFQTSSTGLGLQ